MPVLSRDINPNTATEADANNLFSRLVEQSGNNTFNVHVSDNEIAVLRKFLMPEFTLGEVGTAPRLFKAPLSKADSDHLRAAAQCLLGRKVVVGFAEKDKDNNFTGGTVYFVGVMKQNDDGGFEILVSSKDHNIVMIGNGTIKSPVADGGKATRYPLPGTDDVVVYLVGATAWLSEKFLALRQECNRAYDRIKALERELADAKSQLQQALSRPVSPAAVSSAAGVDPAVFERQFQMLQNQINNMNNNFNNFMNNNGNNSNNNNNNSCNNNGSGNDDDGGCGNNNGNNNGNFGFMNGGGNFNAGGNFHNAVISQALSGNTNAIKIITATHSPVISAKLGSFSAEQLTMAAGGHPYSGLVYCDPATWGAFFHADCDRDVVARTIIAGLNKLIADAKARVPLLVHGARPGATERIANAERTLAHVLQTEIVKKVNEGFNAVASLENSLKLFFEQTYIDAPLKAIAKASDKAAVAGSCVESITKVAPTNVFVPKNGKTPAPKPTKRN